MAVLLAGLPVEIPGATVNRLCGSGMEAVCDAARTIAAGEADVCLAGGSESMTRAPFVLGRSADPFPRAMDLADTRLGWRLVSPRINGGITLEELAAKRPAFRKNGTVTGGNSSPLNDGAAALLLMSADAVRRAGVRPLARYAGAAAAGVHPDYMGIGPVPAMNRALGRAGWRPRRRPRRRQHVHRRGPGHRLPLGSRLT